jgi:protoporphyrinogen oxidase
MTVEEWLTRLSGKRAFERLWRPLLEAKFGDAYRRIPALWYWASFNREKGTKAEVKGYIRGGFKGIADSLVASLRRRGATVHLGSPVEWLGLDGEGRPSVRVRGETLGFDRVVITLPLTTLRELAAAGPLRVELERANTDIDYQGVLNVLVMLRRPLVPHYWIPTVQCGVPFQGIVETTRVIDPEDAGGRHLVYLMNYVHRSHPLFQRDPDQLRAEYVDALLDLFPSLGRDEIIDARVFKAPFVEPIYTPGYGKRKPPAELVPGRVYLANTAQVYPNVTSWNSSTRIARATTVALLKRVRRVG